MCLIAFAIGLRPDLPLWLASNRDESFARPTEPLHRWHTDDGAEVLAGRDLRDGGTWLGLSQSGRVAWLTNVRQATPERASRSRGELVARWLSGRDDPTDFVRALAPEQYGGFNLVLGELGAPGDGADGRWHWVSNRDPARPHAEQTPRRFSRALAPGIYGLSNASLDTPWPKTRQLRDALQQSEGSATHAGLIDALTDHRPAPDDALPRTGVPLEVERALSSPFVRMPDRAYGTRSTTLLRVWRHGDGHAARLDEWQHPPGDHPPQLAPQQHRCEQIDRLRVP